MTIGIAVSGPQAGLAAFTALQTVEKVARGAIGGFVSFAVIAEDGRLYRASTQRGGTNTLFTEGERTGVLPPRPFAAAPLAVLMSSGPNRPEPLAQFTPGDERVGLVTGHRLPNLPGVDGRPLNVSTLEAMRAGFPVKEAVDGCLASNPMADAGLIAVNLNGDLHLANSAFVAKRKDLGQASLHDEANRVHVGVLHNAIHPNRSLAMLAADAAMDVIVPHDACDFQIMLHAGIELAAGDEHAVEVDQHNRITRIVADRPAWQDDDYEGAAINFAAAVLQDGKLLGYTSTEPYCVARGGRLVSISGQERAAICVRRQNP